MLFDLAYISGVCGTGSTCRTDSSPLAANRFRSRSKRRRPFRQLIPMSSHPRHVKCVCVVSSVLQPEGHEDGFTSGLICCPNSVGSVWDAASISSVSHYCVTMRAVCPCHAPTSVSGCLIIPSPGTINTCLPRERSAAGVRWSPNVPSIDPPLAARQSVDR